MAVTETGHLAAREVDDLYRRHGAEVYRYAYAVLGNHADAEDVTQTTFLNAYRALEQGVRPRKPSNWLLTIASNAIKQRFRQEQARPRLVELDEHIAGQESDDDGPSVGELLTALSKIPPQQRQAIVLREFEGRSYSEIAEILGVTTSALETLLFRARRSLAEELTHQLTCTEAQLAISKSVDGRLGRKERRRVRDHLTECPDCAQFARLQQRHSSALRGLMLIPIPLSLAIFKGLDGAGTASAATLPVAAGAGSIAARRRNGCGRCDGDGRWSLRRRSRDQGSGGRRGRERRRGRRRDRRIRAREIARQDPPGCDQAGSAPRAGRAPRRDRPRERSRARKAEAPGQTKKASSSAAQKSAKTNRGAVTSQSARAKARASGKSWRHEAREYDKGAEGKSNSARTRQGDRTSEADEHAVRQGEDAARTESLQPRTAPTKRTRAATPKSKSQASPADTTSAESKPANDHAGGPKQ